MKKIISSALLAFAALASAGVAQATTVCPGSASWTYFGGSLFSTDSARADALQVDALARAYAKARRLNGGDNYVWIRVKSHTDSVGSDAYNQLLSEKRSWSLRKALLNAGAMEGEIHVFSYGENNPRYTNATAAGRHMNRSTRVQIETMNRPMANECYLNHPSSVADTYE